MPSCRRCGAQWPYGYTSCPNDGTVLVAEPGSAGATAIATAPVADDDLPPGTMVGEYEIVKKIGEGGMGSVYGARHPLIGKRVAIKVISRELSASTAAVERFVLEAQAVNQIGNANIVDIFAFGRIPDGRSYFVMEWLQGESLRDRMMRLPLAPSEAIDILETMARTLAAAHGAGIVHRDLKPDNVYLVAQGGERPIVKLLDFGLAKLSGPGDTRAERTRTGMVMGTPMYISPEQARGDKIDGATDVYSLGAMAFEMFVGQVPFDASSAVEIMAMHVSRAPTPPSQLRPGLPPAVDQLVLALMEKDPRQRPLVTELAARLAALRPMFVGVAGPTAHTVFQASSSPGVGSVPGWPPSTSPSSSPPQLPHAAPPRGLGKKLAMAAAAVVVIGGGIAAALVITADKQDKQGDAGVSAAAAEPVAVAPPAPRDPDPVPAPEPAPPAPPEPVAPAPIPAPAVGAIAIAITGGPATLSIDGKVVAESVTKTTLELPPGEYELRAEAPRREPHVTKVVIEAGKPGALAIELARAATKPGDAKPGGAKPGGAKPGGAKPGGAKPGDKPRDVNAPLDPFAK